MGKVTAYIYPGNGSFSGLKMFDLISYAARCLLGVCVRIPASAKPSWHWYWNWINFWLLTFHSAIWTCYWHHNLNHLNLSLWHWNQVYLGLRSCNLISTFYQEHYLTNLQELKCWFAAVDITTSFQSVINIIISPLDHSKL